MTMPGRSVPAAGSAIRMSAGVPNPEQLRLPLYREINGRSGLVVPNSAQAERLRRFLQNSIPLGAERDIAEALGSRQSRIADEVEGRVVFSLDAFIGAAFRIGFESQCRLFAALLAPFGLSPSLMPGALPEIA